MKEDQMLSLLSSLSQDITDIKKAVSKPDSRQTGSNSDETVLLKEIKSTLAGMNANGEQKFLSPEIFDTCIKSLGDEVVKLRQPIDAIHNSVFPDGKDIIVSYLWPWQRLLFSLLLAVLFFATGLLCATMVTQYINNK